MSLNLKLLSVLTRSQKRINNGISALLRTNNAIVKQRLFTELHQVILLSIGVKDMKPLSLSKVERNALTEYLATPSSALGNSVYASKNKLWMPLKIGSNVQPRTNIAVAIPGLFTVLRLVTTLSIGV